MWLSKLIAQEHRVKTGKTTFSSFKIDIHNQYNHHKMKLELLILIYFKNEVSRAKKNSLWKGKAEARLSYLIY